MRMLILMTILMSGAAFSQATYTYAGGPLLSSGGIVGALAGSFTLPSAIGANQTVTVPLTSTSFNIGVYTGSPPIVVSALSVTTDAGGNVESWSLTGYVTVSGSYSELFQSTGYLNGGGIEVFYTVKPYTPTSLDMASAGEGSWTKTVVAPPPPPANIGVLYCVNGGNVYKVVAPSNSTSSLVRPGTTGAGPTCTDPINEPPSWYVQITTNGGSTWSWVTLASLGLGS
jgi:hypothetical protein